jgi:hypothetical protein
MEIPKTSGLVISNITVRPPRFPCEEELKQVIELFPNSPVLSKNFQGKTFSFHLSPYSVRLSSQNVSQINGKPALITGSAERKRGIKKAVSKWTNKSRAMMVSRFSTLDYRRLMSDDDLVPCLITLTYPKNWEDVVPDGRQLKRHLVLLRKRYQRKYGRALIGLWKLEFQSRGAPHIHIFTTIKMEIGFKEWLSKNWTEIVRPLDPDEREKHLVAGTGIDFSEGLKSFDPQRAAVYFTKHSSASFGDKEYQNQVPELWKERGGVGRFWGYWGLEPLIVSVRISEADALFIRRTLRRHQKANTKPRSVIVQHINKKTGEITRVRRKRRPVCLRGTSGFVCVESGLNMTSQIVRAIAIKNEPPLLSSYCGSKRAPISARGEKVRDQISGGKERTKPLSDFLGGVLRKCLWNCRPLICWY